MIEEKEDFMEVIDFVLNSINREDWVDEEVLLIYEDCYRRYKRLAQYYGEDTSYIDSLRFEIMSLYNQI